MRHQLDRLLEKIDRFPPPPERLRALRAVEALERMGTPEARRLLERLAAGAADAPLTLDAKASLERLTRRPSGT